MGKYIPTNDGEIHKIKKNFAIKKRKNKLNKNLANNVTNIENQDLGGIANVKKVTKTYSYKTEAEINKNCSDEVLTIQNCESETLFNQSIVSYEELTNKDLYFQVMDEVSLEGLDGITLEALWKRLEQFTNKTFYFDFNSQSLIWRLLRSNNNVDFFELEEPRPELFIYNRYDYVSKEDGICLELADNMFPDIYPYEMVNDYGVRGSCKTYRTRKKLEDIDDLSLEEAVGKYGNKLVIVADQDARKNAIMFEGSDPITELNDIEYGIIERLGRARQYGEITRGHISLQSLIPDSKSLHHYQNNFIKYDLIRKQVFYIKNLMTDKLRQGRLLHLTRFYNLQKTKRLKIAEQVINLMKTKPNHTIEYSEIRKTFTHNFASVIKVVKSDEFRNHVKTDVFVRYRSIYPNAAVGEWRCGSKNKERHVRVLELKDPSVNISATWQKNDDDSDNDEPQSDFVPGHKSVNKDSCTEVYNVILAHGCEGMTLSEIGAKCEIESYTIRLILRRLLAKKEVFTKKHDVGKQRYLRYIPKCFQENPTLKFDPPAPKEPRDMSVIEEILSRQREAIKNAPKSEVYTVEQAELDRLMTKENDKCPSVIELEPVTIKCTELLKKREEQDGNNLTPMEVEVRAIFLPPAESFSVNLTYVKYVTVNKPSIKEIIKQYKFNVLSGVSNIKNHILEVDKFDNVCKVLLVKLMLGDIVKRHPLDFYLKCVEESIESRINLKDIIAKNSEEKLKESADNKSSVVKNISPLKQTDLNASVISNYGNDKIPKLPVNYMGSNPVVIVDETDEKGVRVVVEMSTPPVTFVPENSAYVSKNDETPRVLSRLKIILDAVKRDRVVEDSHKLSKTIECIEKEEGYDKKIDRKSVFRLFKKLIEEGYAKMFRLLMWDEHTTKFQTFLCDTDIPATHNIIKTCQEQMKLRFFMGVSKKRTASLAALSPAAPPPAKKRTDASPFGAEDVRESISQLNSAGERDFLNAEQHKPDRLIGRQYGFKPKYVRMQILHEFLHYLVRFFEGRRRLTDEEVEELFRSNKIEMTTADLESLPPMYVKEISWKSFIRGLPTHKGWPTGWALVADVILRLPLSILVKLYNVTFNDSELSELLQHPVKRHFLISTLSEKAKRVLFYKRKYLKSIHDILCQLALTGLLQFGPQKQKEKDQVFVFLNTKASIYDTTSSEPGYHKVTEKEYTKRAFTFATQEDIDTYWYQLWNICMNTKLGARTVMAGKNITYMDVSIKEELNRCLRPQTNENARKLDTGEIPGDRRGAGGLDSILWSHIARNWQWFTVNKKNDCSTELTLLKREKFDKTLTYPVPFAQLKQSFKISARPKLQPQARAHNHLCFRTTKKKPKMVRKMQPLRAKKKKPLTDSLDKKLLKRLGKVRVSWDAREVSHLYVNKAVLLLLCPKYPSKNYIPFTVQRDVMHLCIPKSRSKSSEAVKRKMRILHRDDATYRSLDLNFMHLMKIKPIEKYFKYLVYDLTKNGLQNSSEKQIACAYLFAMFYLTKHTDEVKNLLLGASTNFQYATESNLLDNANDFEYCDEENEQHVGYREATSEEEVQKELVKSIIHSNLGCQGDHAAWQYQLFKTYQNYPDNVLHNAVEELKEQQFVTMKPTGRQKHNKKKKTWSNPVQLSSYYIFTQACTYSVQTALEAYKSFLNADNKKDKLDFALTTLEGKKYGQMLCYNEIYTFCEKIALQFSVPEYSLILDPAIEDHSELVEELAIRHQIKIRRMIENQKQVRSKPNPSEVDFEPQEAPRKNTARSSAPSNDKPEPTLDLEALEEGGDSPETIDNLKSWLSKCLKADVERRSPSPEFLERVEVSREEDGEGGRDLGVDVERKTPSPDAFADKGETVREDRFEEEEVFVEDGKCVPTLEEIKKAIVDESANSSTLPYIGDLSNLLTKEAFPERDTDEETLERLKSHFVAQYPEIVDVIIDDMEDFRSTIQVKSVFCRDKYVELWKEVKRKAYIYEPENKNLLNEVENVGGDSIDFALLDELADFIKERGFLGVETSDIQAGFQNTHFLSLDAMIKFLLDHYIVLQCGICSRKFVHHSFKNHWVMDTFKLTDEDEALIEKNKDCLKDAKEEIESQLRPVDKLKVQIMPWIKVDGSFNIPVFRKWLCCVLSYTMENPNTFLSCLFEKYCYVKPVDLFYLLEILQDLDCLELWTYETVEINLFTDLTTPVDSRKATILDNFENMFIIPSTISMSRLGAFLDVMDE
ncbi:unnamed protein product [Brassicogethes aeneus]|uniref:General transcription factor 3C polypeptide 1 n=1 Tax=Brassicogethes aeneus TaxID=1431903 RepID=A0A9P0FB62_BRAAE|nr:unnamed protein product [Brassicogethes aeneus]